MVASLVQVNDDSAATALEVVAGGKLYQVRLICWHENEKQICYDCKAGAERPQNIRVVCLAV